ncbi:head-tail adaptor protein [Paracoccus caeni]|uniref:Head-tail adaptor protein n=1 Tax=Paracoccus caeni TaxID=657651 RepID=A0A934VWA6_9RHOB|nr:head-tail adaptor protein [Paracoccus caeni]MBK4217846.1 head-tail adaptor protein [Paracoccus caeni]
MRPRLNVRLVLETGERQADGFGGFRTIWREIGVLWAGMAAGPGRERSGEVAAESVLPWRITVRAATVGDPRRPVAGQRFRLGERVFRIEAVAEADASGRWLVCVAREEERA